MRIALLTFVLLTALPVALAQHDISKVEPVADDAAIATQIPEKRQRELKRYEIPELSGAQQALGSLLVDGRLRKPLVDFAVHEGDLDQRISIFEGGLVVVKLTGAGSIRKKVLIPEDALQSYLGALNAGELRAIAPNSLPLPDVTSRAHLRVYDTDGSHVDCVFHPGRVVPKAIVDKTTPLRDLMRAVVEDREVTSSVAGYEPSPGDRLVADDQKTYEVVRIIEGAGVVELRCLDIPTTIYVTKKDLHLYFIGTKPRG